MKRFFPHQVRNLLLGQDGVSLPSWRPRSHPTSSPDKTHTVLSCYLGVTPPYCFTNVPGQRPSFHNKECPHKMLFKALQLNNFSITTPQCKALQCHQCRATESNHLPLQSIMSPTAVSPHKRCHSRPRPKRTTTLQATDLHVGGQGYQVSIYHLLWGHSITRI